MRKESVGASVREEELRFVSSFAPTESPTQGDDAEIEILDLQPRNALNFRSSTDVTQSKWLCSRISRSRDGM